MPNTSGELHTCRFVTKPGVSSGRVGGDRQFFFLNGRPVDMPKVSAPQISKPYPAGAAAIMDMPPSRWMDPSTIQASGSAANADCVALQASKIINEMFRSLASPAAAGCKPMAVLDFQLPKHRCE